MADKVLPQRVSVRIGGHLPQSWNGKGGRMVEPRAGEASHRISQSADPGACPRVSGIHGSLSF